MLNSTLALFEYETWTSLVRTSRQIESATLAYRQLGRSMEVRIDPQGRIQIPSHLRKHASLIRQVRFRGMIDFIQISPIENDPEDIEPRDPLLSALPDLLRTSREDAP